MTDFGEILPTIGDFGLFQKLLLLGICFPSLMSPFQIYSLIFTHASYAHHCNTDWILSINPNLTREEQLNLTVPRNQDGSLQSCQMFTPVDWDIEDIRLYGLNQTSPCMQGWDFDTSVFVTSIVSEFDLVCDRAPFLGIAQSVAMSGILFGAFIFGPLAESYGRKRATQISLVMWVIFTVATGLAPNIYVYMVTQCLVGISYGGYRLNGIILATEWIGVTKRSWPTGIFQVLFGFGQCVVAGVAYAIREWRTVQLISASPMILVFSYVWLIPESARWLLDRGETQTAEKLILKAASVNKRSLPDSILGKITTQRRRNQGDIKDLITLPLLRKYLLIMSFAGFSISLTYNALTLNVGNFGLNIFLTQLMFGLTQIPGQILCMWLIEALGRKPSFTLTVLIGGTLCLLILAVPQDDALVITALATSGRVFITWAQTICNVYIQELFPTSLRQAATGLGSIAARVAGLLAPLLYLLVVYHRNIPILVFSSLTLASGVLCCLLPETQGKDLPDSSEETDERTYINDTKVNETQDACVQSSNV